MTTITQIDKSLFLLQKQCVDRLLLMQAFVAVAEEEGFLPASRRLGVSPPVVTRAIAQLEDRLGVRLLERTTRQVRMTEAGARYLGDCKRLLAEIEDVEAAVTGEHQKPRGWLGITASVMFGRMFVGQI
jgi:DNA-binding transcriptional LysR family regulator